MHSRNERTGHGWGAGSKWGWTGKMWEEQDLTLRVSGHHWGISSSRNKIQFALRILRPGKNGGRELPRDVFPPGAAAFTPDPGQELHTHPETK